MVSAMRQECKYVRDVSTCVCINLPRYQDCLDTTLADHRLLLPNNSTDEQKNTVILIYRGTMPNAAVHHHLLRNYLSATYSPP